MAASLHSSLWYRVAALRPRLGMHVRVDRQVSRGELWHVLIDEAGGRSFRLNPAAYALIGRCNGQRSAQEIWESVVAGAPEQAPTQDAFIDLLGQLHERSLLRFEGTADAAAALDTQASGVARRRRRRLNPLALRISLGNPSRILHRLDAVADFLFRPALLWLWFAGIAAATFGALVNWPALAAWGAKWTESPRYALLALLVYPVVKLVHELAHGLAVRRWRGEVREAGITLLVLMPVPYVDASAAAGFRHASQRITVGAAGIIAELAIAAAALGVWLAVEASLVRDLAFVTLSICGASTLLFNANPLLRFDGYFVLADWLQLPNLAARSRRWWGEVLRQRLLRLAVPQPLSVAAGERPWLAAYAPLSWTYRLVISVSIVLWLGSFSFVVGAAVALLLAATLLAGPVRGIWKTLFANPIPEARRLQVHGRAAAAGVALLALVFLIPLPYATVAQGTLWPPEHALVRAETEGFIRAVAVRAGDAVRPGDLLVELENPRLAATATKLSARLEGLEADLFQVLRSDPAAARDLIDDIERTRAELARIGERQRGLRIVARAAGIASLANPGDVVGTYAREGSLLGHVATGEAAVLRVALPEADAALVKDRTRSVQAHVAELPGSAFAATLIRDSIAAVPLLPSAALGRLAGGPIATDPNDTAGTRPLAPIVVVDVEVPGLRPERIGGRAWVRFDTGHATLAEQLARQLRQLLLAHFSPGG